MGEGWLRRGGIRGLWRWGRGIIGLVRLDEGDMKRSEDFTGRPMVATISLGIEGIADKDAFDRAIKYFWVVMILDEDKGATADFAKMRQVRCGIKPAFIRSKAVLGLDRCTVCKIAGSEYEFIPTVDRNTSVGAHSARLTHKSPVDALDTTVLGRGVGCGELMCGSTRQ